MPGTLIYLMGPSGAGKDSLIDAARPALARLQVEVARRVITRSAESKGENAISVTPQEFQRMLSAREFSMSWAANGLHYGIAASVRHRLERGGHVLVNGSRAYLTQVLSDFCTVIPVLLTVDSPILRQRLLARARELPQDIELRLQRNDCLRIEAQQSQQADVPVMLLDNSGDLADTVGALLNGLAVRGIK